MALFRYKGSKMWWYDFRFGKARYRASTKTRSKTLALEAERARRRELEVGYNRIKLREAPRTFLAAVEEYMEAKKLTLARTTIVNETLNCQKLLAMFDKKLVTDFHAADIKKFQDHRLAQGAAPKTVNLEVGTLRAILRRNKCWTDIQPDVRMLETLEEVGDALSEDEEQELIKNAKEIPAPYLWVIVTTALSTGMRRNEIRMLQWWRIDFKKRVIIVGKSKTAHGRNRRIPMNSRLIAGLSEWANLFPRREPEHFVFPSVKMYRNGAYDENLRVYGKGEYQFAPEKPITGWQKPWDRARRAAKLTCRFHDLRHTSCTRMLEAGVPLSVVSALMGWSAATTVQMSKRYGHIGQDSFKCAVSALDGRKKTDVHGGYESKEPAEGTAPANQTSDFAADVNGSGDHNAGR